MPTRSPEHFGHSDHFTKAVERFTQVHTSALHRHNALTTLLLHLHIICMYDSELPCHTAKRAGAILGSVTKAGTDRCQAAAQDNDKSQRTQQQGDASKSPWIGIGSHLPAPSYAVTALPSVRRRQTDPGWRRPPAPPALQLPPPPALSPVGGDTGRLWRLERMENKQGSAMMTVWPSHQVSGPYP
jgi:hypothetical protein